MDETEPGVDAGDPILDAVHKVFEPAPPTYHPKPVQAPPADDPVPISKGHRTDAPSLLATAAAQRRQRLSDLVARGIQPRDAEAVARLLTVDPDPRVRWMAARGLAAAGLRPPLSVLAAALGDPEDRVRCEVVALLRGGGRDALRLLVPPATDRRWPMTQLAALQALSGLLKEARGTDPEVGAFLSHVAVLDPPPLPDERADLAAIARAMGLDALLAWLVVKDVRRLGAVRLLALTGEPSVDRALAALQDDPWEEVRSAARSAAQALRARGEAAAPERHLRRRPDPPSSGEAASDEPGQGPANESALISSLARALADPAEPVRTQALIALGRIPRDVVAGWVERALERGTGSGELAARVAGALRIASAAPRLLDRAAGMPSESRGPYLEALAALAVDPAELAGLVAVTDAAHRQAAVLLAWQVAGHAVLPHLTKLLDDSAGPVRMSVIEVLAESGNPSIATVARERLAMDSSAAVRATAIHALAGVDPGTRLEILARALSDPDPDVRATAVEALPDGMDGVADLLGPAFRDHDERVWRAAVPHLASLPDSDAPVLWTAFLEATPSRREELIRAVERGDPDRLIALAASHAQTGSPEDRALAVELSSRAASVEAVRLVVAALEDPDSGVRRAAAAALSALRPPSAVAALSRSLSDPQVDVRIEAVRALGVIDDDTVPSVLIEALKDPEIRVREMAADGLSRWHSPAVSRQLAAALASPDLRRAAGEVLERMGPMAVPALADVTTGADPEASIAAGVLLDRIAGAEPFVEDLGSIEPDQRLRAVRVLAVLGGSAAADALVSALTDPDVRVRSKAASALGALGHLPAVRPLRRMYLTDPVSEAAAAAEASLRRLGAVPAAEETPESQTTGDRDGPAPVS
jgi:HEAT repeat protein